MSVADPTAADPSPDSDIETPVSPRRRLGVELTYWRYAAVGIWLAALTCYIAFDGVPIDRLGLIAWTMSGLLAASIGRRPLLTVLVDWLPFSAILVAYDLTRGLADALGRPTIWTPQLRIEKWIFGGTEPTVWLQAHLKEAYAPPWEVIVSTTYVSYFFAPYLVAGLLWIRNRELWRKFAVRFVLINLIALACFIIMPAAPPWAAGQCTAAEVADHPSNPPCLYEPNRLADNGLLGKLTPHHHNASIYVERTGTRGFERYGLHIAAKLVSEGQADVNQVASIPSLHAALSMFMAVFLWPLSRRRWRPLLAVYPFVMAFSLVYSAEHYVVDILSGWLVTAIVCVGVGRFERRRRQSSLARADRLDQPVPA